ncbi:hypothetical protein [Mesorhizobium comanense]|uniref:hypothetical protein n=1 Tax=Mesorhizobium comanense TaxID=2502215 RepID=UPI00148597EF|nr:hypothetical protein [Mesorhizobium comanense]
MFEQIVDAFALALEGDKVVAFQHLATPDWAVRFKSDWKHHLWLGCDKSSRCGANS